MDFSSDMGQYWSDLALNWRGWDGTKRWTSLEPDLQLSAVMDKTGHLTLTVKLEHGTPWRWRTEVELILEAGQLEQIAALARDASRR